MSVAVSSPSASGVSSLIASASFLRILLACVSSKFSGSIVSKKAVFAWSGSLSKSAFILTMNLASSTCVGTTCSITSDIVEKVSA